MGTRASGYLALLAILYASTLCSAAGRGAGGFARGVGAISYSQRNDSSYNATGPYTGGAAQLDSYDRVNWNSQPNYGSSSPGGSAGPLTYTGSAPRTSMAPGSFGQGSNPTLGDGTTRLPGYDSYDLPTNYGSIQHADAALQAAGAGSGPAAPLVDVGSRGTLARSPFAKPADGAGSDGEDVFAGYAGPPDARPVAALPPGYVSAIWKGGAYYYSGMNFYRPYWSGGEIRYWPVYPPAGWIFAELPSGAKACLVYGRTYYYLGDVWMQESSQGGQVCFSVVADPFQVEQPGGTSRSSADPDPFQVLRSMSDYLASQPQFTMSIAVTCDEINPTGQKVQLARHCTLWFQRPDKVAAENRYGDKSQRLVFDAGLLTMIDPATNSYGTVSLPVTAEEAIDKLANEYGTVMPCGDLLYKDIYERLARKAYAGRYLEREVLAGRPCDHLAFRQEGISWQIWVESGTAPIPRKVVIRYDKLPAQPQYVLQIDTWSTDAIPASRFQPSLPAGAAKVDVLAAGTRSPAGG